LDASTTDVIRQKLNRIQPVTRALRVGGCVWIARHLVCNRRCTPCSHSRAFPQFPSLYCAAGPSIPRRMKGKLYARKTLGLVVLVLGVQPTTASAYLHCVNRGCVNHTTYAPHHRHARAPPHARRHSGHVHLARKCNYRASRSSRAPIGCPPGLHSPGASQGEPSVWYQGDLDVQAWQPYRRA
jgi:hypothetical protein